MTGSNRKLGLLLALSLCAAPAALAQDAKSTFNQAVEMLQRDRKDEALALFQQVAAMELTPDQAYDLWKSTDADVWTDLLVEGGQFELVAKRLGALVTEAKRAHKNDAEGIKALVAKLNADNPVDRMRTVRQLSAEHGEYAVPYLLPALADSANEERRITMMQTLTQLSVDAVQPLIAALDSEDAFLRRNVAMVLGQIGDVRAAGALEAMAKKDADGACQAAATEALTRVKGTGDACKTLCDHGERYHLRSTDVLPTYAYSEVVWVWKGQDVVALPIPASMYADELAKQSFTRALRYDSACADANSGLVRAIAAQISAAETITLGGGDAASVATFVQQGSITLSLAGPAALDAALSRSVTQDDPGAAIVLVRALGRNAQQPTAGIQAALKSNDGAIRAEAAVACGRMSAEGKGKCPPEVIAQLGEAAGREIARVALVIDADAARSATVAKTLQAAGIMPTVAHNGASGMSLLRRMPGVDAVLLADQLPDVTAAQVIEELRSDPATAKTPVLLLSAAENAAEPYGERVQGVLTKPDDVAAVTGALEKSLGTERSRADALSIQAASVLASLAGCNDIKAAVAGLSHTLASRPDGVTVPAANALAIAGGAEQVDALVAVVADGARSEAARAACAHAIASIVGRGATPSEEALKALGAAAHSDAPLSVREAAAAALGNLNLSHEERAAHLTASHAAQG